MKNADAETGIAIATESISALSEIAPIAGIVNGRDGELTGAAAGKHLYCDGHDPEPC